MDPDGGCDLRLEGSIVTSGRSEPGVVLVRGGLVVWCGPADQAPATRAAERVAHEGVIAPGFIDLHVHGAAGADATDGSLEALAALCRAHALAAKFATAAVLVLSCHPPPVSCQ